MSGEMEFGGNDPFVSIGQKFEEKLVSRQDLFNDNHFGKAQCEYGDEEGDEEGDEDDKFDEQDMKFGKEEDIEVEEIDEIEEIDDSDSDEEMEFGSELDEEESSESSEED